VKRNTGFSFEFRRTANKYAITSSVELCVQLNTYADTRGCAQIRTNLLSRRSFNNVGEKKINSRSPARYCVFINTVSFFGVRSIETHTTRVKNDSNRTRSNAYRVRSITDRERGARARLAKRKNRNIHHVFRVESFSKLSS